MRDQFLEFIDKTRYTLLEDRTVPNNNQLDKQKAYNDLISQLNKYGVPAVRIAIDEQTKKEVAIDSNGKSYDISGILPSILQQNPQNSQDVSTVNGSTIDYSKLFQNINVINAIKNSKSTINQIYVKNGQLILKSDDNSVQQTVESLNLVMPDFLNLRESEQTLDLGGSNITLNDLLTPNIINYLNKFNSRANQVYVDKNTGAVKIEDTNHHVYDAQKLIDAASNNAPQSAEGTSAEASFNLTRDDWNQILPSVKKSIKGSINSIRANAELKKDFGDNFGISFKLGNILSGTLSESKIALFKKLNEAGNQDSAGLDKVFSSYYGKKSPAKGPTEIEIKFTIQPGATQVQESSYSKTLTKYKEEDDAQSKESQDNAPESQTNTTEVLKNTEGIIDQEVIMNDIPVIQGIIVKSLNDSGLKSTVAKPAGGANQMIAIDTKMQYPITFAAGNNQNIQINGNNGIFTIVANRGKGKEKGAWMNKLIGGLNVVGSMRAANNSPSTATFTSL